MDEKRQDIQGDFNGQLANGNINNHYSESRLLNDAEAWEVKRKGLQLIELTGKPDKQVWGDLKKILGNGLRELRLDQEKAAHTILDLWIEREQRQGRDSADQQAQLLIQVSDLKAKLSEAQGSTTGLQQQLGKASADLKAWQVHANTITAREQQALRERDAVQQQLATAQQQIDALRRAKPARPLCQTCSSATANLAKARRGLITVGGLAMLGLMAASFFSYSTYAANQSLKVAEARLTVCEFAGQPYSVGAVLVREDAPDWRCTNSNGAVAWEEIKSKRK